MNKTLVLISDYGIGDPAFTEVMLRLRTLLPDTYIIPQSVPPLNTVATGFWICQIALTKNLKNTYIFSNTAPRTKDKNPQKENNGEMLMYAKLKNGFEVIAVGAGYNLSFIKPFIDKLYFVNVANKGSQFRSRDFYPNAVFQMLSNDKKIIGEEGEISYIPNPPASVIAATDGYGNIKTTIRQSSFTYSLGQKLFITINGIKKEALYTDAMFNVKEGEIAIAPGSSGHDDKFLEIFVRRGNAKELFKCSSEDAILISEK